MEQQCFMVFLSHRPYWALWHLPKLSLFSNVPHGSTWVAFLFLLFFLKWRLSGQLCRDYLWLYPYKAASACDVTPIKSLTQIFRRTVGCGMTFGRNKFVKRWRTQCKWFLVGVAQWVERAIYTINVITAVLSGHSLYCCTCNLTAPWYKSYII